MNRRQTKKELKKALTKAKKPAQPTVQEAWDIVATHTDKLGVGYCLFTDKDYSENTIALHNAGKSFKLTSKPLGGNTDD